jgi:uncharacterized FlaG/YvyC family protein
MTANRASEIVCDAFRVIIDGVLNKNSNPKESYQDKYDKVDKVNQGIVDTLDREFLITLNIGYAIKSKIARNIINFKENNPGSYLAEQIPPEEWMFVSI